MRTAPLLAALTLVLAGCSAAAPAPSRPSTAPVAYAATSTCAAPEAAAAQGDRVLPVLTFPCLDGGAEFALGAAPGMPTVLNLWAPWCGPCREELPLFQQLFEQAPDAVRTVGLVERDTLASSVAYADDRGLTFPSGLDEAGRLLTEEGLNGLPVTYFLTADGAVAYLQVGPIASYDELRGLLAEHLGVRVP